MNKYARLAERHWTQTDPARVSQLEDPQTFFLQLGEQVEQQVQELQTSLAGPDRPGEEYLEKVGRLNMARLQAEERVLAELVWISPPEDEEDEMSRPDPAEVAYRREMQQIMSEPDEYET